MENRKSQEKVDGTFPGRETIVNQITSSSSSSSASAAPDVYGSIVDDTSSGQACIPIARCVRRCVRSHGEACAVMPDDEKVEDFSPRQYSQTPTTRHSGSLPTSSFAPAPSNFYESSTGGASLEEAYGPRISANANIYAKKLATNKKEQEKIGPEFFEVFNDFHDASVKIKVGHTQGSGVLLQSSESQLVVVTVAHIFNDLEENSEIEICLETGYTDSNDVKPTIPLELSDIKLITRNPDKDVVVIALDKNTEKQVREYVQNFPSASFLDNGNVLFMMIHYANDDCKQVTIGHRESQNHETFREHIHMDGGPGASGAPIYSQSRNVVAIQRIHKPFQQEIKSPILIKDVIDVEIYENGSSYVKEALVPRDRDKYKYDPNVMKYLSAQDNPLEIEEGNDAQKRLLDEIKRQKGLPLPQKHLTKKGLPKTSSSKALEFIESKYPGAIEKTVLESLGIGGKHRKTKRSSFKEKIESDHFPPCAAYLEALRLCENEFRNRLIIKRNRDDLPAITIPFGFHRDFDTTKDENFRKEQAALMATGQEGFFEAIKKNFDCYKKRGLFKKTTYSQLIQDKFDLLLAKYHRGFEDALQEHVNLEFINEGHMRDLQRYLMELSS